MTVSVRFRWNEGVPLPDFAASMVHEAITADLAAREWQRRAWAEATSDEPLLRGMDGEAPLAVTELEFSFHMQRRTASRWLVLWNWLRVFLRFPRLDLENVWEVCESGRPGAVEVRVGARRDGLDWKSHLEASPAPNFPPTTP